MDRLEQQIALSSDQVKGHIMGHHITLDIVQKDAHFWSPQLNFRVEEHEDNKEYAVVSGLVGPRPNVWTMFVFIYFVVGVLGFFVSSYGLVQWTLGNYSHLIWGFPITILLLLTAYRAGKYGEKLAADQMELLKQFLRDTLSFGVEAS